VSDTVHEARAGDARRVTREAVEFPAQLRAIPLSPPEIYVRGELAAEDALAVAVVGARDATPYGLEVAGRLAEELAARGVTVVSGLARGIDSAAHRGALRAGGRTVAVLGSGIDVVYPPENRRLAAQIEGRGAVVSQFAPGTPPLAQNFPARNRVIAGLALGVVVVEATERSGSLITAALAAELGREVMAVPGRVTSPQSRGAHRLIQDGAALVQDGEDVIAQLPARWRDCVRPAGAGGARAADGGSVGGGGPERERVLAAIGEEPVTIETVIARSGVSAGRVVALLLDLELEGRAMQLPGQRFMQSQR